MLLVQIQQFLRKEFRPTGRAIANLYSVSCKFEKCMEVVIMPDLTTKGISAMNHIIQYYTDQDVFTISELNTKCHEKYVAATLNALVNHNLLIKQQTSSPIKYSIAMNGVSLFNSLLENKSINKNNNDNLHKALKNKDDEFYTYYEDVEIELKNYTKYFLNKVIFLNCNDADSNKSAFWDYFVNNFKIFGLKELIATSYNPIGAIVKRYDGITINITNLNGNGSYDSEESLKILQYADIVITNPPFSLFRDIIKLLIDNNKLFILIGNENTFASTEIFPLIKERKIWTGFNKVKKFKRQNEADREFGNVCWFTNLPNDKQTKKLNLTKFYSSDNYPVYDNYYTAINIDAIADIPKDYDGIMGVPISYLGKYNPKQFEILGLAAGNSKANGLFYNVPHKDSPLERGGCGVVNGVRKYSRVFIKKI